jgi:transposase
MTRNTLRSWAKNFDLFQVDGLKAPENRHRKSILGVPEREFIKNTLENNPQVTLKFLIEEVFRKYGKRVSKTTMHTEVKNLKYSYITPRPQHYNTKSHFKLSKRFPERAL